jgi:uncharacterized protein YyaL (SSP411 family)
MEGKNHLDAETSPYLLQHKDNPVHWYAWNDEAWKRAKDEDKMVLVSVGYSACHWCHVMEHEVFEDFECAEYMNMHFVCIKVDREERPDVDSIYMDAVHLMGGRGGWPLNVFTLPDGRPIYGGTYFPKKQWLNILENLVDVFRNERNKVSDYANQLSSGLSGLHDFSDAEKQHEGDLHLIQNKVGEWMSSWDTELGGHRRAPKFPMPVTLDFLLRFGVKENHVSSLQQALLTLMKMARGGIYDQIGGGFCRYSVDAVWKVPHFEKMLYDNAQLLVTYANAFSISKDDLFRQVVEQTIEWAERELRTDDRLFCAALDADSEGVEGKFYCWTELEFQQACGEDFDLASAYFALGKEGFWEHGMNILLCPESDAEFSKNQGMSFEQFKEVKKRFVKKLFDVRSSRIRPGLDDKALMSWNAMMVSAYLACGDALQRPDFTQKAEELFASMSRIFCSEDLIYRTYTKGKRAIHGFLDDYAFFIKAAIELYESTGNSIYLKTAEYWTKVSDDHFYQEESGIYAFSSENLLGVARTDIEDNVIPSSLGIMVGNLERLSLHLEKQDYRTRAMHILQQVLPRITHGSAYSHWLNLLLDVHSVTHEVVVTGPDALNVLRSLRSEYLPECRFAASTNESELPLFRGRNSSDTTIYVCTGRACHAPVHTTEAALRLLREF